MPRTAGTLQGTRERTKQEKRKPQKCGEQGIVTREPDKQRDLTPASQVGTQVPDF